MPAATLALRLSAVPPRLGMRTGWVTAAMASGLMFPIESMPKILQWLSCIVPARWFIAALKKVMIQGVGFENAITEFAVLGFMAAFYVALSLKKFKIRL